jgi:uncharacterized protein with HEPN domain
MEKTASIYIKQILDAIILLESYVAGLSRDDFLQDSKTQDAVAMRLQFIAELTKKLPEEWRNHHKEISWVEIVGMRNQIAHKYLEIDWARVWLTLQDDLPGLKDTMQAYLKDAAGQA